jgi:hypothetical protein
MASDRGVEGVCEYAHGVGVAGADEVGDRALNPLIERHCRAATEHGRQICRRCSLTGFTRSNLTCTCCPHGPIVSEDQRIAANIELITELGPEPCFRYLVPGATAAPSSLPCKLTLSTAVDGGMGTISTETLRLGVDTEDRLEGLLAVTALAAKAGAPVVRVHEVEETRLTVEMIAGIVGNRPVSHSQEWIV